MLFRRGRRWVVCSALIALLIISVLQIWVSSAGKAEARRILNVTVGADGKDRIPNGGIDLSKAKMSKEEVLNKYFRNGRGRFSDSNNRNENGFRDSKRRIPSCPDPLHNKL